MTLLHCLPYLHCPFNYKFVGFKISSQWTWMNHTHNSLQVISLHLSCQYISLQEPALLLWYYYTIHFMALMHCLSYISPLSLLVYQDFIPMNMNMHHKQFSLQVFSLQISYQYICKNTIHCPALLLVLTPLHCPFIMFVGFKIQSQNYTHISLQVFSFKISC